MTSDERREALCVLDHAFHLLGMVWGLRSQLKLNETDPKGETVLATISHSLQMHAMKLNGPEDPKLVELREIATRMRDISDELQTLKLSDSPASRDRWWALQEEFTQLMKRSDALYHGGGKDT